MSENEKKQLLSIIENISKNKGQIPFFYTLQNHKIYGQFFKSVNEKQKKEISDIINEYIDDYILGLKTKGGSFFQRFYQNDKEMFWKFRNLNEDFEKGNKDKNFQNIGKIVENKMFELEGLLTQNMFKRPEGLDKVLESFYKIVYNVFPFYNNIE